MFVVASFAGAVGAMLRYLVTGFVQERSPVDFPTGTMTVNVLGSLALGFVIGVGDLDSLLTVSVIGFLGGFTTFSTWMVETLGLGLNSPRAILNLTFTLAGGVAAAALGYIVVA